MKLLTAACGFVDIVKHWRWGREKMVGSELMKFGDNVKHNF